MTVGEVLMKRKRARLRQREVTQKLGWNQETLTDIELERVPIADEGLALISDAIDQLAQEKNQREEVMAT